MLRTLDLIGSTIASSTRSWRGTTASKRTTPPEEALVLYDREGCPACRLVREALTELNLDAMIIPCPKGGNNLSQVVKETGNDTIPLIIDKNTDKKIQGTNAIVDYLFDHFRGKKPPKALKDNTLNDFASKLATSIRLNAGITVRPSRGAEQPLTLYSFESSPYSRPVRELLCELELPYQLINIGKQQRSDMGPAKLRFTLKPYKPLPNTKREAFFNVHGNVQVPFLIDPNTGTELFESADIIRYLKKTYAL